MAETQKKKFRESDKTWYDNAPVGKNSLYNFMSNLSEEAGLSKRYTNHCIRATSITTLDHKGVEARHIMSVSGHKSESSIKCYSTKLSDEKKRQMSDILCTNIPSKCMKAETVTSCTASAPEMPDFLEDNELDQILTQITDHELNQICYPENVITKPAEVVPLPVTRAPLTPLENSVPNVPSSFNFSNCNVIIKF